MLLKLRREKNLEFSFNKKLQEKRNTKPSIEHYIMTSIIALVSLLMVMFGPNESRVNEMASMSNLY